MTTPGTMKQTPCGHIHSEEVLALARELPGDGRPTVLVKKPCQKCMTGGGWGYKYGRGTDWDTFIDLGDPVPV